jgi:phage/plasmid-associated DNA primase
MEEIKEKEIYIKFVKTLNTKCGNETSFNVGELLEYINTRGVGYEHIAGAVVPYVDFDNQYNTAAEQEANDECDFDTALLAVQQEYPSGKIYMLQSCGLDTRTGKYKNGYHAIIRNVGYYESGADLFNSFSDKFKNHVDPSVYKPAGKRQLFRMPYCSKEGDDRPLQYYDHIKEDVYCSVDEIDAGLLGLLLVQNIAGEKLVSSMPCGELLTKKQTARLARYNKREVAAEPVPNETAYKPFKSLTIAEYKKLVLCVGGIADNTDATGWGCDTRLKFVLSSAACGDTYGLDLLAIVKKSLRKYSPNSDADEVDSLIKSYQDHDSADKNNYTCSTLFDLAEKGNHDRYIKVRHTIYKRNEADETDEETDEESDEGEGEGDEGEGDEGDEGDEIVNGGGCCDDKVIKRNQRTMVKFMLSDMKDADISDYVNKMGYFDDYMAIEIDKKKELFDIYHYNGVYWEPASRGDMYPVFQGIVFTALEKEIKRLAKENLMKAKHTTRARKGIAKLKQRSSVNGAIANMLTKMHMKYKRVEFDTNPNLIAFDNGVYELPTVEEPDRGNFRPGRREDFISKTTGYNYVPTNTEKLNEFAEVVNKIMPDVEVRRVLFQVLGSCLVGAVIEHFIILTGCGRNGKDVINSLLENTIGSELYISPSTNLIMQESKSEINQELANTDKKRVLVVNEPNCKQQLKNAIIKKITGGSTQSARGIYSTKTNVTCHATTIMQCNAVPDMDNIDEAMLERLIIIHFKAMFRSAERIAELGADTPNLHLLDAKYKSIKWIKENRANMFCMMVRGLSDLYKQHRTFAITSLPDTVKMSVKQYVADTDDIFGWFNMVFMKADTNDEHLTMKQIYNEYSASEYYQALPKRQQRKTNAKSMKNDICASPNLKPDYRERFTYMRVGESKKRCEVKNCLIGWKYKIQRLRDV